MDSLPQILNKLENCVRQHSYESLETDWLEIKPVPSSGNAWDNIRDSICAFLNTRGGLVILGVKDEQQPHRHYSFTGYTENNSGNLSALRTTFKDAKGNSMDVGDCLLVEVKAFATGHIAVVRVNALAEDRKFMWFAGKLRRRMAYRNCERCSATTSTISTALGSRR